MSVAHVYLIKKIQSNAAAARILSDFHCSACTDVTGFGLIGHLLEMIQFETSAHGTIVLIFLPPVFSIFIFCSCV